jgi:hypothetical protein
LAIGALTGIVIGFLQTLSESPEGGATVLSCAAGGAIGGLLIGLALPAFSRRWLASAIVSVAGSASLFVAFPRWGDVGWPIYPFMGVCAGIVYGVLVWRQPAPERILVAKPGEADRAIDSRDA